MGYYLAVWEGQLPRSNTAALRIFNELMDRWQGQELAQDLAARLRGEHSQIEATPTIACYVNCLTRRWPDITTTAGEDSPWSDGPLANNATGPLFYFGLTGDSTDEVLAFAVTLARQFTLVCFDPQTGELL
jgi:hypothetical protein